MILNSSCIIQLRFLIAVMMGIQSPFCSQWSSLLQKKNSKSQKPQNKTSLQSPKTTSNPPLKHQNHLFFVPTSLLTVFFFVANHWLLIASPPLQPVESPPRHKKIKVKQLHCLLVLWVTLLN